MKSIIKFLTYSTLVIAGSANAAMITITADVYLAENYDGLVFGDTITADITFDDALTGVGTETLYFNTTNTLDITAGSFGSFLFDESMKSNISTTSITFEDGYLVDFSFSALFEENSAPEQFHSSLTTATADRDYRVKGQDIHVGLYAEWDTETQFIAAVPVPAAVWLFGSGLLGLAGVARRKAA